MSQIFYHEPVLASEIVAMLVRKPGIYVDGTLGGGGHSFRILQELDAKGCLEGSLLIGIDQDDAALKAASEKLKQYGEHTELVKGNFCEIGEIVTKVCDKRCLQPGVSGILLDLGVSSFQIDTPERGFSYLREGSLDMRMDTGGTRTAGDIINSFSENELAGLFFRYGEEPKSRRIARAIVAYREKNGPVTGTEELAGIIRKNMHGGEMVLKTLSRVFQALRIEVNDELEVLRRALYDGIDRLEDHGRMAVISYHSLEDRIVKTVFAEKASNDWGPKGVGLREPVRRGSVTLLTRKPVLPGGEEVESNPRARSAKLRVIEKISHGGNHDAC